MKIGLLWLDADKSRSFDEKVKRAVEFYNDKYGRLPELCHVNANMLPDEKEVGQVQVIPQKTIQPNHFWLGMKTA